VDERVTIRAPYERFPASVKGALVVRGADGMPHQVRLVAVRLAECAGRGGYPVPVESTVIEAAPTMDTFVPFEVSTLDVRAGWYEFECEVIIDGDAAVMHPGKRLAIAWPRGSVRRGAVSIGITVGETVFGSLECVGDSVRITYTGPAPHLSLRVDGEPHPILAIEHDAEADAGRVVAYPVLRRDERMTMEVKGADPVELDLP
jgi:hypothetical protein